MYKRFSIRLPRSQSFGHLQVDNHVIAESRTNEDDFYFLVTGIIEDQKISEGQIYVKWQPIDRYWKEAWLPIEEGITVSQFMSTYNDQKVAIMDSYLDPRSPEEREGIMSDVKGLILTSICLGLGLYVMGFAEA